MPATKDTVTAPPLGQTETKTKEDSHKFEFEKQEMAKPNKLFDLYCGDSSPPRGQLVAPFSGCSEFIPLGSDYKHKDFADYLGSCKNPKDFKKIGGINFYRDLPVLYLPTRKLFENTLSKKNGTQASHIH